MNKSNFNISPIFSYVFSCIFTTIVAIVASAELRAQDAITPEYEQMSQLLSLNRVDGPTLAIGTSDYVNLNVLPRQLKLKAASAFSFSSQYWQGIIGLQWQLDAVETRRKAFVQAYRLTKSYDGWKSPILDNSILSFLTANDEFDYWRSSGVEFGISQALGNNWEIALSARGERWATHKTAVHWSLFGSEQNTRANPAVKLREQRHWIIRADVEYRRLTSLYGYRKGWVFQLRYDNVFNSPNLNRFEAELSSYLPLDYIALHHRIRLGASNATEFPQVFSIGGRGSLPALETNSMWGNRMILINTEILLRAPLKEDESFWREFALVFLFDAGVVDLVNPDEQMYCAWSFDQSRWAVSWGLGVGSRNGVWQLAFVGPLSDLPANVASNRLIFRFSPNF